eukprot:ANDGO_08562.mRNA.1 Putative L-cysteine desulfhydrase 1
MQKKSGYKAFGSFHSEDPEKLIRLSDEEYVAPNDPFCGAQVDMECPSMFGTHLKTGMFMLDDQWTFLNHGAFGACFKSSYERAELFRRRTESQPLRSIDRELFPLIVHATRQLASFLKVTPHHLVLTHNVTQSLNAAFSHAAASHLPELSVLILVTEYGAVKKMAEHYSDGRVSVLDLEMDDLQSADSVVECVRKHLDQNPRKYSLAVFDHISSNTAILYPVQQLVSLCRSRGVRTLVDGAHALGSVPCLNLAEIDADYYVGNCHKWFSNPRGCAFLAVREFPTNDYPHNPIVSHGRGHGLLSEFIWDGNQDYSAFVALIHTLHIWNCPEFANRAHAYMGRLLHTGAQVLMDAWRTGLFVPLTMSCPTMTLVQLPPLSVFDPPPVAVGSFTSAHACIVQDMLHFQHQIEVPVKCIDGNLFVRVSAHIYNAKEEFSKLAEAVRLHIATNSDQ